MAEIRVGFLSSINYASKMSFSGTLHSMHQALKSAGIQVEDLGWPGQISSLQYRVKRKLGLTPRLRATDPKLLGKTRRFTRHVEKQLKRQKVHAIFAPVSSKELTLLNPQIPVVIASDATFKLLSDAYQHSYAPELRNYLEMAERRSIQRATRLVYSSEWASQSAIDDYGADPDKIRIVPFGANIENPPQDDEIRRPAPSSHCQILFVGRDYERKGGQVAIDSYLALKAAGAKVKLVMLGCEPPEGRYRDDPGIEIIPFLDKNHPEQMAAIRQLYQESHFFLLPTRADCSPIVLCEANAYGIPAVTTRVGGIPSIIEENENGMMLPLEADGQAFAKAMKSVIDQPGQYQDLSQKSRRHYSERLNWKAWGNRMREIFDELDV